VATVGSGGLLESHVCITGAPRKVARVGETCCVASVDCRESSANLTVADTGAAGTVTGGAVGIGVEVSMGVDKTGDAVEFSGTVAEVVVDLVRSAVSMVRMGENGDVVREVMCTVVGTGFSRVETC
jgi:hypothetical protein